MLPVAILLVGGTQFSHTHADPLPECDVSGALGSNQTWGTDCVYVIDTVVVPNGITLTIDPGAIVKEIGTNVVGIQVNSGGTLDASGSSGSHITFTSYKDDTAGGDTNGDGSSTSPAVGNYKSAIAMNGGTADVSYTDFKYANITIAHTNGDGDYLAGGSDLTITDSTFAESNQAIAQVGDDSISLERNSFALDTSGSGNPAIAVDSDPDLSGIVLAGANENTFSGSKANIEVAANGDVPSETTWEVDSGSGAVLSDNSSPTTVDGTLTIDDGVVFSNDGGVTVNGTVNLEDGAIVKELGSSIAGIQVNSGGTLDVDGTSENHVTFTSYKDDTAGGDTNGDGSSTSPAAANYRSAIAMNGGTADVSYSDFKYANIAIAHTNGDGGYLDSGSDLTITDSSFTDSNQAIDQSSDGALTLERNSFALDTSSAGNAAITVDGDPDLSGIVLEGTNENTFSGSNANMVVAVDGTVPTDSTWTLDNSSSAVVFLNGASDTPAVSVDGTVDINPGVVVKVGGEGFDVQSDGVLNATGGTSESHSTPIVFTSLNDSTVGGGSNGNPSSTGSAGNYTNAIRFEEPSSSDVVDYVVFKYATKALSIGTTGTLNVSDSQFTNDVAALDGDTTSSGSNPILDDALSEVCAWPYANQFNVSNSWFGSSGYPGNSLDLSGYLSESLPDGYPGLSELYDWVTSIHSINADVSDNTIPWTDWSCGIPDTEITVDFPVTDVNVNDIIASGPAIAGAELWSDANLAE